MEKPPNILRSRMYDVIVVGGRCAGASTAMLLAKQGLEVLLVERGRFPSDVISTHVVQHSGLACLKRWGLLEAVESTGCPPLPTLTLEFGEFEVTGMAPATDGIVSAYAPRRFILDTILSEAAERSGAEVRQGFNVERLLFDNGRVTGVEGECEGVPVAEQARVVIGADGVNSKVAELVGSRSYHEVPSLLSFYYSYWSGVEASGLTVYMRPRRGIAVIPTNDGLVCIGVAWPVSEFSEFRRDLEGNFLATLDLVPELAERVREGRREERLVGTRRQPNFFRIPYGEGWALVGDAGYNRDAITAQGIGDAFRSAEMLSQSIAATLSGEKGWGEVLEGYQRQRDQAFRPIYDLTCQMANFGGPSTGKLGMLRKISEKPAYADRYAGLFAGTVSVTDFMSPTNLAGLMA
jgi:flavin-dependent dehydrogenase